MQLSSDPVDSSAALSVVMPAYNADVFIEEAIDSILSQTFTNLELIIVDDASTDRTWSIITERAANDPRIRAMRNATNLGLGASINLGVSMATAPLIGRMDADDVSDRTRFEKQIVEMEANPHFAVVGTFASHINENGKILGLSETGPSSEQTFHDLRRAGRPTMVFGGTALFTKELFQRVGGFDATLRAAGDVELFDRMADHGPIVAIAEPLLLYRLHPGSTVATRFREGRQVHRFVRARREAQNNGAESMDLTQFKKWERSRPVWVRIRVRLDDSMQHHYREAGMAYGNRNRAAFVRHFAIAFMTNPIWVARRLWRQRLSQVARAANRQR